MNTYQVNVSLDENSVQQLLQNGFQLYAFRAIDGPSAAVPLVWFNTRAIASQVSILWQEQYGGYTSTTTPVAANAQIIALSAKSMTPGQLMTVGAGGIGAISNGGAAGALELLNSSDTTFTCGVTVVDPSTGKPNPICAFELLPGTLEQFVPIEKIFLMFAALPANAGTVLEQSFGPGILIDMTGQVSVDVQFTTSRANGWSGPGNTTTFSAGANLLPLLVNPGGSAGRAQRAAQRALARRAA